MCAYVCVCIISTLQVHDGLLTGTDEVMAPNNPEPGRQVPASVARRRRVRLPDLTWPPNDAATRPPLASKLSDWSPTGSASAETVDWARAVAWRAGTHSAAATMRTARAALRHAERLTADGVALDGSSALSSAQVEHTIATVSTKRTPATRAYAAGALRSAAATINPSGGWTPPAEPVGRRPPTAPYTDAEQAHLLDVARHLQSARRRAELTAAVALMCGAGLTGQEVARCSFDDIDTDAEGRVKVTVAGRQLPVRARFAGALASLSAAAASGAPVWVNSSDSAVCTMHAYARSHGMAIWDPWRATNAWRVFQLGRVPLPVLARGLTISASHVAGLLNFCPNPDGDALAALCDDSDGGGL